MVEIGRAAAVTDRAWLSGGSQHKQPMAMNPYFQAGIQMSQQAMEREDGRADRELRTQMNRLKANDIIKGMEVDAEVKNFFDYAKKNAKTLDKAHPGYASQLMGIANTEAVSRSPLRVLPVPRVMAEVSSSWALPANP